MLHSFGVWFTQRKGNVTAALPMSKTPVSCALVGGDRLLIGVCPLEILGDLPGIGNQRVGVRIAKNRQSVHLSAICEFG